MEEDQPVDEKAEPWPTVTHTAEQERDPNSNTVQPCSAVSLSLQPYCRRGGRQGLGSKECLVALEGVWKAKDLGQSCYKTLQ